MGTWHAAQPAQRVADSVGMSNEEETGSQQPATGNAGALTGNGQQATGSRQRGELRWGSNIAARLLDFAAEIIRIVKPLPKDVSGRHVASQLVRAATSGGANYEEARASESRADFVHKLGIAAKEIREAVFWLRVIERSGMTSIPLRSVWSEANELAAILAASARTARANM